MPKTVEFLTNNYWNAVSGLIISDWNRDRGDPDATSTISLESVITPLHDNSFYVVGSGSGSASGRRLSQDYSLLTGFTSGELDASPTGFNVWAMAQFFLDARYTNSHDVVVSFEFYDGDPSVSPAPTLLSTVTTGTVSLTLNTTLTAPNEELSGNAFQIFVNGSVPTGARYVRTIIEQTDSDSGTSLTAFFGGINAVISDQAETSRVTQIVAEIIHTGDAARITQLAAEILHTGDAARITQLCVEVIASTASAAAAGSGNARRPRVIIAAG